MFFLKCSIVKGVNVSKQTTADTRKQRKSQSEKVHKLYLSNSIKVLLTITLIQRMPCWMVLMLHLNRKGVVSRGTLIKSWLFFFFIKQIKRTQWRYLNSPFLASFRIISMEIQLSHMVPDTFKMKVVLPVR